MSVYTLILSAAVLIGPGCPDDGCPVLIGKDTPKPGTYRTSALPYKAIQITRDNQGNVYALHPAWTDDRMSLFGNDAKQRVTVTQGCVNLRPSDFEKLSKQPFSLIIRQ